MSKEHNSFPDGITEFHSTNQSRTTQFIYDSLLVALVTIVAVLPRLQIDISVKSPGILRSTTELNYLKATSSGTVKRVLVQENDEVIKGQLLFDIQSPVLEEREHFLTIKVKELNRSIQDLSFLIDSGSEFDLKITKIKTFLYRQSFLNFRFKLLGLQIQLQKVKQDFDRNRKLFETQVIAATEFENFKYELDKVKGELQQLMQSQLSAWQVELKTVRNEMLESENQARQVSREKENLNIKAPVSGFVQNIAGIYSGSQVFANQDLAEISPKTKLVAEVYVSPNDIGFLRENMDVRMQISAFNYNQWGHLKATVQEISNDIQLKNNQPVFKVKCALQNDHLTLKNGSIGTLKKGMVLQARFLVVNRSLWQLLFDKADDWFNPDVTR